MSFIAMTALATPSSTRHATPTAPNRPPTAGARYLVSCAGTLASENPAPKPRRSGRKPVCSYIVEKTAIEGSAKGPNGWMRIDTANVYFDHPYHAPFAHALAIDFVCEANGAPERV